MLHMPNKSDEQKDAEAEVEGFRKALGPFVVAAESTRMAMAFTDAKEPDNPIIFANASFLSLTGYDRQEILGQSFNSLLARGCNAQALAHVEAGFGGRSDGDPVIQYRRKDGSEFWASIFISPVPDGHGEVVQNFVSLVDVTRHHQAKIHAEMLIAELNHRVKNTLSTVQSIAKQALAQDLCSRGHPGVHRVPPARAVPVPRPADTRALAKCRAARFDQRSHGAI